MKKYCKKVMAFIISTTLLSLSVSFSSFAEKDFSAEDYMRSLAEQTISIVTETIDNSTQITYKNIDTFIEKTHCLYPAVSDLEIAKFVLQYTNQGTENLPDEIILRAIESKEVTTREDYIAVDASGAQTSLSIQELQQALATEACEETISPQDVWISSNGYMKIETVCSFTKKQGEQRYYTVSARAEWLKMPVCFFEDVLAIAHTGKFDDSYPEFGYKYQDNICCESVYKHNLSTNFPTKDISFDYPSATGTALRFKLQAPLNCYKPVIAHIKMAKSISAYLIYGIIVDAPGTLNVKSAYCHKEVAVGSIGISCVSGGISFSLSGFKHDYNARILTVNVT